MPVTELYMMMNIKREMVISERFKMSKIKASMGMNLMYNGLFYFQVIVFLKKINGV